jgi:pimeloyl-ACP methyl ester carboxylesterase
LLSGSSAAGPSSKPGQTTADVFDWPAGRWLVGLAGVVMLGVAAYQLSAADISPVDVAPEAARSGDRNEPPPLVCVHGLSGSSRWWTRVAALIEGSRPVVLVDVPRSLKPSEVATWLAGGIEELRPPVDLAGHSLGALVSVRVAALRPELVRRLVLISPTGIDPPRTPLAYAWPLARTMLHARPSFLVRLTYDGLRAGPRNLARGGLHVASADVTAELIAVTAPTLLVWGARDGVVPVKKASTWLERLPDARLIVIPGAGHVPMVESPLELADAIGSFLEERFDEARDHQRM